MTTTTFLAVVGQKTRILIVLRNVTLLNKTWKVWAKTLAVFSSIFQESIIVTCLAFGTVFVYSFLKKKDCSQASSYLLEPQMVVIDTSRNPRNPWFVWVETNIAAHARKKINRWCTKTINQVRKVLTFALNEMGTFLHLKRRQEWQAPKAEILFAFKCTYNVMLHWGCFGYPSIDSLRFIIWNNVYVRIKQWLCNRGARAGQEFAWTALCRHQWAWLHFH